MKNLPTIAFFGFIILFLIFTGLTVRSVIKKDLITGILHKYPTFTLSYDDLKKYSISELKQIDETGTLPAK